VWTISIVTNLANNQPVSLQGWLTISLIFVPALVSLYLMRRGHVRVASVIASLIVVLAITFSLVNGEGSIQDSGSNITAYTLSIIMAGLLLGGRGAFAVTLLISAILAVLRYGETGDPLETVSWLLVYVGTFVLLASFLRLAYNSINDAFTRLRDSYQELEKLSTSLEERVVDRTRDLALAVEVGRSVSQVRDLDKLLTEAAETIRDRFDLYYTQVYLADAEEHTLTLRAGTGTAGKELLRRGHHLLIGPGSINGVAAVEKQAVIVADTATSPIFRANSLLPDTRSEMAVPLIAGERVVGVIDLQSSQPNALTEDNLPAFEAVAGQLAVAIENANLFTEVTQARAELEAQIRELARESWRQFLDGIHHGERLGYSYDRSSVKPLDEPLTTTEEGNGILATDIAVTGEPVGAIQLEAEQDKIWTPDEVSLVASVAQQVGQQVENLRLLAEAERYRAEAEEANRRLVREGWQSYQQDVPMAPGYVYDQKEVTPLPDGADGDDPATIKQELVIRGETIGYLEVAETSGADGETAELLTAVAEQLSAHIENLRLSEQTELALAETKQRSEELAVINETARIATSILDTKALLETVMSQLQRVLPIDSFTTALFDRSTNSLRFLYVYDRENGVQYDLPPTIVEPHHISHRIIQTKEPEMVLFTAQEVEENRKNRPPNLISDEASITASLLFAPMMRGDEVMGLISVQSYQTNAYTDSDLSLVTGIASYVATALQNAQLFEEIRQQGEKERIINQVSEKIQRTLTMEDALQTAVTALGQALNVRHAQVEILQAASQTPGETAVSSDNGDK
jgi:GAF domain-containing protein